MIYLEPRAGLCNRMRTIASAYHLAKEYNTRLVVLWRISKGLNCSYYDLFCEDPFIEIIETRHKICFRMLIKVMQSKKIFYNISEKDIGSVKKALSKNDEIYINTVHKFYDVGNYEMFIPIKSIKNTISQISRSFNNNVMGVHIRRTDNENSIKYSPLELFTNYIDEALKKDETVKFYLATDDIGVENELLHKYGKSLIINQNKVLDRSSKRGIEDALIDLGCLSQCNLIVGSYYSSFSETAALWMSERPLHILVKREEE